MTNVFQALARNGVLLIDSSINKSGYSDQMPMPIASA
jgi:hypothetical protein